MTWKLGDLIMLVTSEHDLDGPVFCYHHSLDDVTVSRGLDLNPMSWLVWQPLLHGDVVLTSPEEWTR